LLNRLSGAVILEERWVQFNRQAGRADPMVSPLGIADAAGLPPTMIIVGAL
jgi:hypothetical protein